jgi:hypothetical protein
MIALYLNLIKCKVGVSKGLVWHIHVPHLLIHKTVEESANPVFYSSGFDCLSGFSLKWPQFGPRKSPLGQKKLEKV